MNINTKELIRIYGVAPDNWGDLSYFQGDYINFGFWKNIQLGSNDISIEDRVKSSRDLYWEIIKNLDIKNTHTVLEAGCGRGMGVIDLLSQIPLKKIIALDMNSAQLEKVKNNLIKIQTALNIEFLNTNICNTQLPDSCVDRVFSIEAVQHFDDIISFAQEMKRILKQDGKIILTTYFLKQPIEYQKLVNVLPHVEHNLEKLHLVSDICESFYNAGFKHITYTPIGEEVFYGYDRWLKQMNSNLWSQQFYQAYKQNIIDYYIVNVS